MNTPSQIAVSTCCTCGHSWPTGTDGSHSCEKYLTQRAEKAEAVCAELMSVLRDVDVGDDGIPTSWPSRARLEEAKLESCGQNYVPIEDVKPLLDCIPYPSEHDRDATARFAGAHD